MNKLALSKGLPVFQVEENNHQLYIDESSKLSVYISVDKVILLFSENEIDAVLFATNYLAISGLMVLRSLNKEIGENCEVIAYDDHIAFKLITPQVSAVEQPLEEIADKIIDLVLSRLSKDKRPVQRAIFPAKLILRRWRLEYYQY